MIVHTNETAVRAKVTGVTPCADGYGHDVELEVLGNDSPDPKTDFLKPKAGEHLTVFAADLGGIRAGARVRATVGLSGGPFGQRAVLRAAEPVKS
jgi:hypothetical protein